MKEIQVALRRPKSKKHLLNLSIQEQMLDQMDKADLDINYSYVMEQVIGAILEDTQFLQGKAKSTSLVLKLTRGEPE